MTPRCAVLVLLTTLCLASPGCATGVRRPTSGASPSRSAAEIKEDDEHADLERELGLYSD